MPRFTNAPGAAQVLAKVLEVPIEQAKVLVESYPKVADVRWLLSSVIADQTGMDVEKIKRLKAIVDLFYRMEHPSEKPSKVEYAGDVVNYMKRTVKPMQGDRMFVVLLDRQLMPIVVKEIGNGGNAVTPREMIRPAYLYGSSHIITVQMLDLDGVPTPNPSDVQFTQHMAAGAILTDIHLLDHLVVTRAGFISLTTQQPYQP